MLLILEVLLTVFAWKRGRKGLALLPLGIGMGFGFLLGIVLGVVGASTDGIDALSLVVDIACVGALIGMIAKPRQPAAPPQEIAQRPQNIETKPL